MREMIQDLEPNGLEPLVRCEKVAGQRPSAKNSWGFHYLGIKMKRR